MFNRKALSLMAVAAMAGVGGIASSAHGSAITLSITASGGNYSVYATFTNLTDTNAPAGVVAGLATYALAVDGSGGASVTSGYPTGPGISSGSNYAFDAGAGSFGNGTVSGTNVTLITASQGVLYGSSYSASKNKYVILNLGIAAGTLSDTGETYSNPLLIATGTYTGTVGTLTALTTPGGQFQALRNTGSVGTPAWTGPGQVDNVTTVTPGTATLGPSSAITLTNSVAATGTQTKYVPSVVANSGTSGAPVYNFSLPGESSTGHTLIAIDIVGGTLASFGSYPGTDVTATYASLFNTPGFVAGGVAPAYDAVLDLGAITSGTLSFTLPAGVTIGGVAIVPEPSSIAGLALLGLPVLARRRRA